jgi:hypothetical protein
VLFFWVTFLNLLISKLSHRAYRSCTRQRLRRSVASVFIVFAPNSMYVRSMNTNQINHIWWPSKTNHTVAMHDVDTVTYMLKGSECSMLCVGANDCRALPARGSSTRAFEFSVAVRPHKSTKSYGANTWLIYAYSVEVS